MLRLMDDVTFYDEGDVGEPGVAEEAAEDVESTTVARFGRIGRAEAAGVHRLQRHFHAAHQSQRVPRQPPPPLFQKPRPSKRVPKSRPFFQQRPFRFEPSRCFFVVFLCFTG